MTKWVIIINKVLEVPHIPSDDYIEKSQEIDIVWLRYTIILEEFRDQVF